MCEIERVQPCLCIKPPCQDFTGEYEELRLHAENEPCPWINILPESQVRAACQKLQNAKDNREIPKTPPSTPDRSNIAGQSSHHIDSSLLGNGPENICKKLQDQKKTRKKYKSRGTQTIYRESETQTLPWAPPYVVKSGHNPEVLMMMNFTWGHGLPAGMHELEIINRMRIRRAWEQILPPMDTPANIKIRSKMIAALEAEEWAFRESEIQFIMDLRMELAEKSMQSHEKEKKAELECRLKKLDISLSQRKQQEVKSIRNKFARELRKLAIKHGEIRKLQIKQDLVKKHIDRDLDCAYPEKARYDCSKELRNNFTEEDFAKRFEHDAKLPGWFFAAKRPVYEPKPFKQFCKRTTDRAARRLLEISQQLDALKAKADTSDMISLLKRKPRTPSLPLTPRRQPSVESLVADDEVDKSAGLIQNLVKGRAIQCTILEGRNRCRDLIEELQSLKELRRVEGSKVTSPIKLPCDRFDEDRAKEIIEAVESKSISKGLEYLNDELEKLEEEKKAQALALLAERERVNKEIAQLTKEQLEINERRELDEVYRQILKVNQESVETYLEDILKEGIEWLSEKEAEKYITELADKTDELARSLEENAQKIDEEGIVSDMVYNFVLPQVEKETARKRLLDKQLSYLCAAHASIYDEILNMPAEVLLAEKSAEELVVCKTDDSSGEEFELDEEDAVDLKMSFEDGDSFDGYDYEIFERIVEHILSYIVMPDEKVEEEIREILIDVLRNARRRIKNSQLNMSSPPQLITSSARSSGTNLLNEH